MLPHPMGQRQQTLQHRAPTNLVGEEGSLQRLSVQFLLQVEAMEQKMLQYPTARLL